MQKRNLFLMALFSLLTLGIYILFWLFLTRRDVVRRIGNLKAIPPLIVLLSPFLVIVVAVPILILSNFNGSDPSTFVNLIFTMLGMFFIVGGLGIPLWWFYKYFKAVHQATGYTDGMLLYIIWMLCAFIAFFPLWMLLVQNDINKTVDREGSHPIPPAPNVDPYNAPPAPPAAPGYY